MDIYFRSYPAQAQPDPGHNPVVIIHGLFGASGNWHTLSKNVFSRICDVYTLDLRNHGRSPHDASFTLADMVQDLEKMLDRAGLQTVSLLGHSLGGRVAMQFAITHPERVDRLILADIAPSSYPARHHHIFDAMKRLPLADLENREDVDDALSRDIASAPVRQFLLKNLSRKGSGFAWKLNLDAIEQGYAALNEELKAWPPFTGETLFIRGSESDYVTDANLEDVFHLFPAALVVTIEGAGHWLHAEKPEEFAALVASFLESGSAAEKLRLTAISHA